jgi:hypothetical protein
VLARLGIEDFHLFLDNCVSNSTATAILFGGDTAKTESISTAVHEIGIGAMDYCTFFFHLLPPSYDPQIEGERHTKRGTIKAVFGGTRKAMYVDVCTYIPAPSGS